MREHPLKRKGGERGKAGVPGIISKSNSGRMSSSTPVLPGEGRRSDMNSSSGQQVEVQSLGPWVKACACVIMEKVTLLVAVN